MDHIEAIQGKFTERYLLGELTPAVRDQFEEHFFDCAICSTDVEAGAVFLDNARAVLKPAPPPIAPPRIVFTRFGMPFQAAACAFVCLLCVVGYENVVTIPRLRSNGSGVRVPEILPAISLLDAGSRADNAPVLAKAGKDFILEMEIPGGPEFTGYLCEIRDSNKQVKFSLPVTPEQAKSSLRLAIPGLALPAGKYEVDVTGQGQDKVPRTLFQQSVILQ
jgi:hypothetical protein